MNVLKNFRVYFIEIIDDIRLGCIVSTDFTGKGENLDFFTAFRFGRFCCLQP